MSEDLKHFLLVAAVVFPLEFLLFLWLGYLIGKKQMTADFTVPKHNKIRSESK